MKKNLLALLAIMGLMLTFSLTSCDKDDKDSPKDNDNENSKGIVGTWVCYEDAYGDSWGEPLIILFNNDGSGYLWFSDEPFSNKELLKYSFTESRITIQNLKYDVTQYLEYELSQNGKSLTIYGFDDNDMSELHFEKDNSFDITDKNDTVNGLQIVGKWKCLVSADKFGTEIVELTFKPDDELHIYYYKFDNYTLQSHTVDRYGTYEYIKRTGMLYIELHGEEPETRNFVIEINGNDLDMTDFVYGETTTFSRVN